MKRILSIVLSAVIAFSCTAGVTAYAADSKPAPVIENLGYETEYIYKNLVIDEPQAEDFSASSDGEISFEWYDSEGSKLDSAPIYVGSYKLKVIAAETDAYSAGEKDFDVSIDWLEGAPDPEFEGTIYGDGFYKTAPNIKAPSGYEASYYCKGDVSWSWYYTGAAFTEALVKYVYLRKTDTGEIARKEVNLKVDWKNPTVTLNVGEDTYTDFANSADVAFCGKDTMKIVTIAAEDNQGEVNSSIKKVEYIILPKDEKWSYINSNYYISSSQAVYFNWIEYKGPFAINPAGNYIIYVRATDICGNYKIIKSDRYVLYKEAEPVTEEATYYLGSASDTKFYFDLNGNTVSTVVFSAPDGRNSTVLPEGTYSVGKDSRGDFVKVSAAIAETITDEGEYLLTINLNPSGHTFEADENFALPEPLKIRLLVKYSGEKVIITAGSGKEYDGTPVDEPDYSIIGGGESVVEYKEKDAPDSAYSQAKPIDAGDYTARVTVTYGGKAAYAYDDFTIAKRSVTVVPKSGQGKVYGEPDGKLEYYLTNNIEGETLSGSLAREEGENKGEYAFILGSLSNPNYNLQIREGEFYTIEAKDIWDSEIIIGESPVYTGTELEAEFTVTLDGKEFTYDVSGNTAANVGAYELVITGSGNYCGEKKAVWYVQPDTSGIDSLTKETAEISDKSAVEEVAAMLEGIQGEELASHEIKAQWQAIKDKCTALIAAIAEKEKTAAELEAEIDKICTELEQLNEKRVTIYWENDILSLAEKIDSLLENEMLDAEGEEKLLGCKAQTANLLSIIHNPVKYISFRFFWLIVDMFGSLFYKLPVNR